MNGRERLKWTWRFLVASTEHIWKTQPLIAFLCAAIIAALCLLFLPCGERKTRLAGMGLQLVGVVLVGIGLIDIRRTFEGLPTTWESIKLFFQGWPKFGPQNRIVAAVGAAVGLSGASARGRGGPGPNTPLEQRVQMLEQQYSALFDEVGQLAAESKRRSDELSRKLDSEVSERKDADQRNHDLLRRAIAGGVPLGRVGFICVLLGTLGGGASSEISSLFGGAASCDGTPLW